MSNLGRDGDTMRPTRRLSTPCPCCQRRIGIGAGIKAPTPFTICCPYCKTWLFVRMRGLVPLTLGILALVAALGAGLMWVQASLGGAWMGACVVLLLAAGLALDIALSVILFTNATFTPINKAKRRQTL